MFTLDMKTVIVIFILVNYICTYLLALTWTRSRSRFDGVGFFLANFGFQSAGMTLSVLRGVIPPALSILAANMLIFCGVVAFVFGTGKFLNVAVAKKPYYGYCVAFALLYSQFTFIQPDIRIRTIIFAGMLIPVFSHIVALIFLKAEKIQRKHAVHMGVTFLLFALLYIFRAYHAFAGGSIRDYFNTPTLDSFINALTLLLTILLMYSIQFMINDKLLDRTEQASKEQKELLRKMERLATRDHMTGIYNRRRIEEVVRDEIKRYQRFGHSFCVILCDIDNFKSINDEYGHDIGDRSIVYSVGILRDNVRDADMLGRWGGEEFLIVAPGTSLPEALQVAERLRMRVAENQPDFFKADRRITLSFGVAEYVAEMQAETVIKLADQALYRAKDGGRNRVEA